MDRVIEKKKGITKKHLYYAGGVILLVFVFYMVVFADHSSTYRADSERLTVSTVSEGLFNDYISVVGKVEPITTIYLDAMEGGRVEDRMIDEGTMVKKGDVILKLENRQLYQTILNSEAALAEKENYLRNTKISFESEMIQSQRNILQNEYELVKKRRTYERNKILIEDELISRNEYLESEEDYEYEKKLHKINLLKAKNDSLMQLTTMRTLEQDLEKMRLNLDLVYERLDNLEIKAPVDGQLGMLDAEIGQSISQGQRIGMIHVLTNFKVNANIDEHYIDRVRRNLEATLDRNDSLYALRVKKVYPEVREGQFQIDMVFGDAKPANIRTGQTYHIKLQLGQPQKAILIPRGGFFQSTGGQWVYVLNNSGTEAVKRNVRIGKQNPQYYEILEGLEPGDKVITSSYEIFGDNDKIILK